MAPEDIDPAAFYFLTLQGKIWTTTLHLLEDLLFSAVRLIALHIR